MEEKKTNEQKEQKSNLSFYAPVDSTPNVQSASKKNLMVLVVGSLAGLISALVAHMLANTISIMFWAFTENGPMYLLVLYGQLLVYTILLYIFSYWVFKKWEHTSTNKTIFLSSYFLFYIIMFLFWRF